jgi:hypothetical protein
VGFRIVQGGVLDHIELLTPLLEQHVEELATRKDLMILDPDWDRYASLEMAGALVMLYAWHDEELVGYSCSVVTHHMHYKGLTVAHNDVLFITKPWRSTRVGFGLMAETERAVRARVRRC